MKELDTTPKTLAQLMTLWQPYLHEITPLFDRLMQQANTKSEQTEIKNAIAEAVGVSYRQVNRLLQTYQIPVPPPISSEKRAKKRENAQKKRETREKYALDVIAGLQDAENAAEQAEVTVRHMYRLMSKLCLLVGIDYRDMAYATYNQRKKVVEQIEAMMEKGVCS